MSSIVRYGLGPLNMQPYETWEMMMQDVVLFLWFFHAILNHEPSRDVDTLNNLDVLHVNKYKFRHFFVVP